MIKHIVCWNFKENVTFIEKERAKLELENLLNKIDGLEEVKVYINLLNTSDRQMVLDSTFISNEALLNYQIHKEHQKVAEFVKNITCDRVCLDYNI
ncbi:MAG: Dabb family protein [Defluviitaleaceae bacterium]|nr:Dabb family protein [Defluviitaleaceae bacterium]